MNKKEKIIESALKLFANQGFNGVSTAKIAKESSVSEGLIFRHFKSKKGLLDAILIEFDIIAKELISPVLEETDGKKILKKAISVILNIDKNDYNFWKLQYKLKIDDHYETRDKIQVYIDHLVYAFKSLNYKNPHKEADLLYEIVDAFFRKMVYGEVKNTKELVDFLFYKYQLD